MSSHYLNEKRRGFAGIAVGDGNIPNEFRMFIFGGDLSSPSNKVVSCDTIQFDTSGILHSCNVQCLYEI